MSSQPGSGSGSPGRRERTVDAAVAVGAFLLGLALLSAGGDSPSDPRGLDAEGVLLAAAASLPLLVRRRAPLAVFAVTATASAVLNARGYAPGPPVGATLALFFLALAPETTRAPKWVAGAVVGLLLLVHAGGVGVAEGSFPTVPLLFGTVVWGAAWVIGDQVRQRRARVAQLEERARRAVLEAERERRLAAAEERTRIARDLHDSVGHAINVILVHAGAARLLGDRDPERTRAALEAIEEVARETIGEIDQLVGALRRDDLPTVDGVEPPPGLAALETLLDRHRTAGLAVDVRRRGAARSIPPGTDQAAFRIVQEALTNAARHGEGSAEVELHFADAALEVRVTNPVAPGEVPGRAKHGVVGMRERAALLGGTLDIDVDDGSFSVVARLPYPGPAG